MSTEVTSGPLQGVKIGNFPFVLFTVIFLPEIISGAVE